MKERNFTGMTGVLLLVAFMMLGGCSGEEEVGVIEQASDKMAGKAVEYINKPLDKAKNTQAMQNAQAQKTEDMLQETGN